MNRAVQMFPIWVLVASVVAVIHPPVFAWFSRDLIGPGLMIIMLGMGLTLEFDDFSRVLKNPGMVALGVMLQFILMPLAGFLIAKVFSLGPVFSSGLVLVACCPGGTASNVVSYLARADLALSVSMTATSTLVAIVLTPLLTSWLAGSYLPVNGWMLFWSTLKVVLMPVVLGVFLRKYLPAVTSKILPYAPLAAVVMIVFIVASIISRSSNILLENFGILFLAVFLLHFMGFASGYLLARVFTRNVIASRTISIEVGMQNSGLGAYLSKNLSHGQPQMASVFAVPSAVSAVMHSLLGSILAGYFATRPVKLPAQSEQYFDR